MGGWLKAFGVADQLGAAAPSLGAITRDVPAAAIARGMSETDFSRLYALFGEIVADLASPAGQAADRRGGSPEPQV